MRRPLRAFTQRLRALLNFSQGFLIPGSLYVKKPSNEFAV
jgi:hypothetical protein